MAEFSFVGEYPGKVDSKGRIVLPSKFRIEMFKAEEKTFVVRKGFHAPCLMVYPESEWKKLVKQFTSGGNPLSKQITDIKRRLVKGIIRLEFAEENGRMNIPNGHLDLAGIDKDVILTGLDNYIEIWDKEKYDSIDAYSDAFSDDFEKSLDSISSKPEGESEE